MSWQAFVDDQLIGSRHLAKAAMIGLDGAVWATKPSFLQEGEGRGLAELFKQADSAVGRGITVGGVEYECVRADEQSIFGKKGATGVVCAKTGQTIIIGIYDENHQPGNSAVAVGKLAEYLSENGY